MKDFLGRETELNQISSFLHDEADRPRVLVLHGMRGQGKSRIALRHSEQAHKIYRGIFWVKGTLKFTATQSLISIAHKIDASVATVMPDDDKAKVAFVHRTLQQWEGRWLMVLDNYDDQMSFSDVEAFIPQSKSSFLQELSQAPLTSTDGKGDIASTHGRPLLEIYQNE